MDMDIKIIRKKINKFLYGYYIFIYILEIEIIMN